MKLQKSIGPSINRLAARLGFQVVRTSDGLPPPLQLMRVFNNLASGYAAKLEQQRGIKLASDDDTRNPLLARLLGTLPIEAFEIIAALAETSDEPGEVCEFGVAQGETSALIAEHIRADGRSLHLYDSFKGLPAPTCEDVLTHDIFGLGSMAAYEGQMAVPIAAVQARLAAITFPLERVTIHEGFVMPDFVYSGKLPDRISFAFVDFDLYEPIKTVLAAIEPRLTAGALVIVDDYGHFSAGAQQAVDEFIESHPSFDCQVSDIGVEGFAILRRSRHGK
jgi:predicted O-methyltransferase YrrM